MKYKSYKVRLKPFKNFKVSNGDLVQCLEGTGFCCPLPQIAKFGGRRGTHCLLELKCWLSVGRCIWYHLVNKPISKMHGYSCTIAYFDLNSVEIVDHQRHPQAAECGCVHLPSKQLELGMSDSYTQLMQPPDNRPMLLFNSFQSAYRNLHSTETVVCSLLLSLHDHLINAVGCQQVTYLCLLGLSAVFDTIDHSILLDRLSLWFGIGIHGTAVNWFE